MITKTILILILIICFILSSMPLGCKKREGFYVMSQSPYPKYCGGGCGYKNRWKCMNCLNCGLCLTPNGYEECVPGNSTAPYFRSDCISYTYGRSYNPYYNLQNIYTPTVQPEYKPWWRWAFPKFWSKKFSV